MVRVRVNATIPIRRCLSFLAPYFVCIATDRSSDILPLSQAACGVDLHYNGRFYRADNSLRYVRYCTGAARSTYFKREECCAVLGGAKRQPTENVLS